ncbi:MAG: hypothetical protein ACTSRU_05425 [Candidatus Hodarchaeales archaeon]
MEESVKMEPSKIVVGVLSDQIEGRRKPTWYHGGTYNDDYVSSPYKPQGDIYGILVVETWNGSVELSQDLMDHIEKTKEKFKKEYPDLEPKAYFIGHQA